MPTFTEITIEDLRRVKQDPINIYRQLLGMDFGCIVPSPGETPESVRTGMLKMASALGVKVEFYLDGANPDAVIFEVTSRNQARAISTPNGHVEPVTVEQSKEMAELEPVDMSNFLTEEEEIGFPDEVEAIEQNYPQESQFGGIIGADSAMGGAELQVNLTPKQPHLPAFAPPIDSEPAVQTEPVKVRRRRTKEQIAADEAAKNQPQVTISAPEPKPVAAGTVFEGIAKQEHPLVAAENVAKITVTRRCPNCLTAYAMAKICPQCGQMTEEIPA